jgi:hypothetical protein
MAAEAKLLNLYGKKLVIGHDGRTIPDEKRFVARLHRKSRGRHTSSEPDALDRGIFDKQTRRKSLTIATERG